MISHANSSAYIWDPSQGTQRLKKEFDHQGFILLKGIRNSEEFLGQLGNIGRIYHHHDSLPNGLTQIKHANDFEEHNNAIDTNRLGLTQDGLVPHTDRSGLINPPKLLAFWIERQSKIGGASLFVDGQQLFDEVSIQDPAAIEALTRPRSVIFKSENGLMEGSIFHLQNDDFSIRFRFDRMVYLSPDVASVMPRFLNIIKQFTVKKRLESDEGYLIDNHRWLHGRTHFTGERLAYRILLDSEHTQ
jgi:alpha-ketoglutarate-dependent taurine dioxygenase